MDERLCDELLEEIFRRAPATTFPSVALVSRRWLSLLRSSLNTLSLRLPFSLYDNLTPPSPTFSTIISHYPYLSTLTLLLSADHHRHHSSAVAAGDSLILFLAAASLRHLRHLRLLHGPVSPAALASLSSPSLTSLQLSSLSTLSFHWLSLFPSLLHLSLLDCSPAESDAELQSLPLDSPPPPPPPSSSSELQILPLETLTLTHIRAGSGDDGLAWLWRHCGNLRRLQLRACESTGGDLSAFAACLPHVRDLELRTCRPIADAVLLLAADHCRSIASLLLHDGGSRDGLHRFLRRRGGDLRSLDLRLPLDLDNSHLSAIAATRKSLSILRLQSCCLVTGEGLTSLGRAAPATTMEELALINCNVIGKEPGLLTFLGQNLKGLKNLDLSHNELLLDKELGAMLASCGELEEIRLRGCRRLTDVAVFAMIKCCKVLKTVDIIYCPRINFTAVESLVVNSPRLRRILVEEGRVSSGAANSASRRGIQLGWT